MNISRILTLGLMLVCVDALSAQAGIGCPSIHDGKQLIDVGLYKGRPSPRTKLKLRYDGYIIPRLPRWQWSKSTIYTLGCEYGDSSQLVSVPLPRSILVCELLDYERYIECR